ncbi:MAG TPA: cell division protein SepF [Tissierellaceae bacterium]
MAKFMDKFKYFIGIDDYEDEDEYFEEYEDVELIEGGGANMYETSSNAGTNKNVNNVVSIHTNDMNMKIVIHEPQSYDEAPKIVDDLKKKKVAVVNFESLDLNLKRQIFDFVSGALYSMEGKIQKVTTDIFIVAPKSVQIDGLKDELKDKGIFTW